MDHMCVFFPICDIVVKKHFIIQVYSHFESEKNQIIEGQTQFINKESIIK